MRSTARRVTREPLLCQAIREHCLWSRRTVWMMAWHCVPACRDRPATSPPSAARHSSTAHAREAPGASTCKVACNVTLVKRIRSHVGEQGNCSTCSGSAPHVHISPYDLICHTMRPAALRCNRFVHSKAELLLRRSSSHSFLACFGPRCTLGI